MAGEDHKFDRRGTDPNVAAIATRVHILEGRFETLEDTVRKIGRQQSTLVGEVQANTRLTEEIHGKIEDTSEKNAEMYAAFAAAKNAIKLAARAGDAAMRVSDVVERRKTTI